MTPDELATLKAAIARGAHPECPVCGLPLEIWLHRTSFEVYKFSAQHCRFQLYKEEEDRIESPYCASCIHADGDLIHVLEEFLSSGRGDSV